MFITILIECIFILALGAFMAVRNFAERVLTDIAHTWWMVGVAYVGKKLQENKHCEFTSVSKRLQLFCQVSKLSKANIKIFQPQQLLVLFGWFFYDLLLSS